MSGWRKLLFPWLRDRRVVSENQFTPLDIGLNVPGTAVAVGFFTPERNLDVFVLSEDKKQVTVYAWDVDGDKYLPTGAVAKAEDNMDIVGVVASDFNHDGFLDLLVSQQTARDKTGPLHHALFLGDGETLKPSGWTIPASLDELALVDFEGRMLVDLLGVPAASDSKILKVWSGNADDPAGLVHGFTLRNTGHAFCRPLPTHSHAFADFDGDGIADLLLTCHGEDDNGQDFLQLWTVSHDAGQQKYTNPQSFALQRGHGPISVADMNADGSLDIVYAVCDPPGECTRKNSLQLLFNTQRPFCKHPSQENCRKLGEMMKPEETFGFDARPERTPHHAFVNLDGVSNKRYRVMTKHPVTGQPVVLGIGDYDANGFPDVLLPVYDVQDDTTRVLLLENVPCGAPGTKCSPDQIETRMRTLVRSTRGTAALEQISGVVSAAFINFYQDGPPDILVNYLEEVNEEGKTRRVRSAMQTIQNGFVQNAFFLRTETLSSVCPAPCMTRPTGSAARRPYGAGFPGPNVKFSFTDFDGALQIRSGYQLPQTGHGVLLAPFVFFGLDSANNFVELLMVRTPARHAPNLASKAGLVPNSDLIINPPHADSPSVFRFELHILPGKYFLWVLISIGTAMLVLGALTAFFKWRELQEDNEERRKALHAINYDAL